MTIETAELLGPLRKRESSLWMREPNDWYVEPPWCSHRLFASEPFTGSICDPACGGGNIVMSALAAGYDTHARDIVRRTHNFAPDIGDWLSYCGEPYDNIVCNPPFRLCDNRMARTHPFVEQCLRYTTRKVALLLPTTWLQGDRRSRWLENSPLRRVYFLSPRPSMPPGQVIAAGQRPGNGTIDYAWFVFVHGNDTYPEIRWLRRDD